jgi:ribosomal protein S18 acetylase RimI-like enzyme
MPAGTDGCDPPGVTTRLLATIETYYDAAPRPGATTEEVGPFSLFVRTDPGGRHYYARPRLGDTARVTPADVDSVRARQRELAVPESLEWVHETTPSLVDAVEASGLRVERCPLLVLPEGSSPSTGGSPARVRVLDADDPGVGQVVAAVNAGFEGTDEVVARPATWQPRLMRAGLLAMAGAHDDAGRAVGGGSHGPRGTTTELTGIAVLPRARRRGVGAALTAALVADAEARGVETVFLSAQDDAVARVYKRVGFVRVGTACIAEPA